MRVQVKVLRDFPYGDDGIKAVMLKAGETHDIHEELVDGLHGEGFIKHAGERQKPPAPNKPGENGSTRPGETKNDGQGGEGDGPVAIPDDWATLQFMSLKALANKFDPAAKNKPECVAAIEAEIAKRNDRREKTAHFDRDGARPTNARNTPGIIKPIG